MRKMELFEAIKRNCLPDYLSILQWERLMHPDPDNQRDFEDHIKKRRLTLDRQIESESLIAACKNGLPYQGDIKGWEWEWVWGTNPYPSTDNGIFVRGESQVSAENIGRPWEVCHPYDCVIHKLDMMRYLKSEGKWPIKGLPDSYWHDGKPEAEAVGDDGTSIQTEPKPLNNRNNDTDFSGLLNIPKKTDDWFNVIDDMTSDFHKKWGEIPNKSQAWGALYKSPPKGYEITTGTDKGEDCLKMPGAANLGKRAFIERWKKYTA